MHIKKRMAVIYCTIVCALLLILGRGACTAFIDYMDWEGLFTIERGKE